MKDINGETIGTVGIWPLLSEFQWKKTKKNKSPLAKGIMIMNKL